MSTAKSLSLKEVYRSPPQNIHGYIGYLVKYADSTQRTILAHRELIEQHIGRQLSPSEVVHHINGCKQDNRIENLHVVPRDTHGAMHATRAEPIQAVCITCGAVCLVAPSVYRRNQIKLRKAGPFCDKSCAGKYARKLQIAKGINTGKRGLP